MRAGPAVPQPASHSRLQLLVRAEARVGHARLHQFVHVLLVDGGALTLAVRAVRAAHIGPCTHTRVRTQRRVPHGL